MSRSTMHLQSQARIGFAGLRGRELMNCPHCAQPIDPRLIRKAANTLAASAPRPGSTGNTRNPYGRKGKPKEPPQ